MKTVAIANHKGGSAKTTTVVNLAAALGELGVRVLVIDLDPQGSATTWLGLPLGERSILDVYLHAGDLTDVSMPTSAPGVDLVPSSPWLVAANRDEDVAIGLGVLGTIGRLALAWDYVLLDCPPSYGALSVSSLAACLEVIIPVEATVLALTGLVSMIGTIDAVRERLNPELRLDAIIACRLNRTRHARKIVERMREHYPGLVLNASVRETAALAEAPSSHLPITRYTPNGAGAADYRAVALELLGRDSLVARGSASPAINKSVKSRASTLRALLAAS